MLNGLAPEGGELVMKIFLMLNGAGVVFLLYVLANFWKEGRRSNLAIRRRGISIVQLSRSGIIMMPKPTSRGALGGQTAAPYRVQELGIPGQREIQTTKRATNELPLKKYSTR
jgi:hypothetical protein